MTTIPIGIKVISALYLLGGIAYTGTATLFMFYGGFWGYSILVLLFKNVSLSTIEQIGPEVIILGATALFIFLSIAHFALAAFLFKLKNWARIIVIGLTILAIFMYIPSLIRTVLLLFTSPLEGILILLFDTIVLASAGFIIWYLGFNKEVKNAFQPQIITTQPAEETQSIE